MRYFYVLSFMLLIFQFGFILSALNVSCFDSLDYGDGVLSAEVSADGKYLAIGGVAGFSGFDKINAASGDDHLTVEEELAQIGCYKTKIKIYQIDEDRFDFISSYSCSSCNAIRSISWNPKFKDYFAVGSWCSKGNSLQLCCFDSKSKTIECIKEEFFYDVVTSVDWHPTGEFLVVGGWRPDNSNYSLRLYRFDGKNLSLKQELDAGERVFSIAWSSSGKYLAVGGIDSAFKEKYVTHGKSSVKIYEFDYDSFSFISKTESSDGLITSVFWVDCDKYVVAGGCKMQQNCHFANLEIHNFDGKNFGESISLDGKKSYFGRENEHVLVKGNSKQKLILVRGLFNDKHVSIYRFNSSDWPENSLSASWEIEKKELHFDGYLGGVSCLGWDKLDRFFVVGWGRSSQKKGDVEIYRYEVVEGVLDSPVTEECFRGKGIIDLQMEEAWGSYLCLLSDSEEGEVYLSLEEQRQFFLRLLSFLSSIDYLKYHSVISFMLSNLLNKLGCENLLYKDVISLIKEQMNMYMGELIYKLFIKNPLLVDLVNQFLICYWESEFEFVQIEELKLLKELIKRDNLPEKLSNQLHDKLFRYLESKSDSIQIEALKLLTELIKHKKLRIVGLSEWDEFIVNILQTHKENKNHFLQVEILKLLQELVRQGMYFKTAEIYINLITDIFLDECNWFLYGVVHREMLILLLCLKEKGIMLQFSIKIANFLLEKSGDTEILRLAQRLLDGVAI